MFGVDLVNFTCFLQKPSRCGAVESHLGSYVPMIRIFLRNPATSVVPAPA